MKICVTGGHLTPAAAVIDEISRIHPEWKIIFAGRLHAFESDKDFSEEYRVITGKAIPFVPITAWRVSRYHVIRTILTFYTFPLAIIQGIRMCLRDKPTVILSFGSYVAVPVVIAGFLCGIPIVIHEQTGFPGLANRFSALFAAKICISDRASVRFFPATKTVWTGIPLRKSLFHSSMCNKVSIPGTLPLIYISGGTTGAKSLNTILYPLIPKLVHEFRIIHQVGRHTLPDAQKVYGHLPQDKKQRYVVLPYLEESLHAYAMQKSVLVIGRSGANTVSEVEALGKVALFIPLPWASGNEQYINAKRLADAGSAVIIDQASLSPEILYRAIQAVIQNISKYQKMARDTAQRVSRDGSARIVRELIRFLKI